MGFCLEEKGGERREVWEDVSSNSYNQGSELFLKLLLTLWVVRWAHTPLNLFSHCVQIRSTSGSPVSRHIPGVLVVEPELAVSYSGTSTRPPLLELSKTPKPTAVRRVSDSPSDDVRGLAFGRQQREIGSLELPYRCSSLHSKCFYLKLESSMAMPCTFHKCKPELYIATRPRPL